MVTIHHSAAEGYSAKADTYVHGRPDYPADVDCWLRHDLGLVEGKIAVDLGAGTGKFSPRLLATGAAVVAIEPVVAMRERLVQLHPGIEVKEGSAEHIPLGDLSVDTVVCAQSFHWFANLEALRDICRVLKPGGGLGLIWNVRDETVGWVAALTKIMEPYEGDTPRYRTQEWRRLFPADGFGVPRVSRFSNGHTGSPEQVIVARILSVSFIAALPDREQQRVASQVRELIARTPLLSGKAVVTFPYETVAFSCTKLG
jgi:SAM-dependent methyltransferase